MKGAALVPTASRGLTRRVSVGRRFIQAAPLQRCFILRGGPWCPRQPVVLQDVSVDARLEPMTSDFAEPPNSGLARLRQHGRLHQQMHTPRAVHQLLLKTART